MSQDYDKLRHVLDTLTPGLVFAGDAARYGRAIAAAVPPDVEVVLADGTLEGRASHRLRRPARDATPRRPSTPRMRATGPDTITKFLFTSGSTKLPKAVINTHRMWCANQQQMRQSMPALAEEPPVLVDWLPWNHTFGGNHNVGITLYNGGTLYIDDGKPTPALHGRDAAQPARDRAHRLLQRADRLRGDRARDEDRRAAAQEPAVARAHVLLRRRRAGAAGLGQPARDRRRPRSASASSWAPAWA